MTTRSSFVRPLEHEPGGSYRVLVVDDQTEIGDLVARAFAHDGVPGCRVDYAASGTEAYAQFVCAQASGAPYQLAVIDLKMPGWDGYRTANEFWAVDRDVWIIFMSGGGELTRRNLLRGAAMPRQMLALKKPFTLEELRRAVGVAAADARRSRESRPAAPDPPGGTDEQSLRASALLRRLLETDDGRTHSLLSIGIDRRREPAGARGHEITAAHSRLIELAIESRLTGLPHALFSVEVDVLLLVVFNCDAAAAQTLARQLIEVTTASRSADGVEGAALTLSIGITAMRPGRSRADEVRLAADVARRTVHARGGGCLHVGGAGDTAFMREPGEQQTIPEIEFALDHGRFATWAQPIMPLGGLVRGSAPAFELLVRMRDRNDRLRGPATFLPVAENHGLAPRIDRMMISTAIGVLENPGVRASVEYLSVNVGGRLLNDPAGLQWIEDAVAAAGRAARQLCIEITESVSLQRTDALIAFILRLRERGVRFALDDFGAGFSNLSTVETLPVDILKFDGALVRGCAQDRRKFEILCRLNDIGRLLDKTTIAEHVEDQATLDCVRESGIDYGQGYGIALPSPLEDALGAHARKAPDGGA